SLHKLALPALIHPVFSDRNFVYALYCLGCGMIGRRSARYTAADTQPLAYTKFLSPKLQGLHSRLFMTDRYKRGGFSVLNDIYPS
ncbi:hypothetical protein, partial [Pseudomonas syringae]|uniref:hypothetical protein n=1 Tax=Pseudomonas syringae TaxID=317 RepID=UPI001F162516